MLYEDIACLLSNTDEGEKMYVASKILVPLRESFLGANKYAFQKTPKSFLQQNENFFKIIFFLIYNIFLDGKKCTYLIRDITSLSVSLSHSGSQDRIFTYIKKNRSLNVRSHTWYTRASCVRANFTRLIEETKMFSRTTQEEIIRAGNRYEGRAASICFG